MSQSTWIRLRPCEIHLAAQMVSGLEQIKGCVVVAEQPLRLAKIVEEPSAEAASTDVARKFKRLPMHPTRDAVPALVNREIAELSEHPALGFLVDICRLSRCAAVCRLRVCCAKGQGCTRKQEIRMSIDRRKIIGLFAASAATALVGCGGGGDYVPPTRFLWLLV